MDFPQSFITENPEETQSLGYEIGTYIQKQQVEGARIVALYGELGSGKTTLLQGFARSLGLNDRLLSPTFVLMRSYELAQNRMFHHMDLYKITSLEELRSISFQELITDANNIIAIEWADRLGFSLPSYRIDIQLQITEKGHTIGITKIPRM